MGCVQINSKSHMHVPIHKHTHQITLTGTYVHTYKHTYIHTYSIAAETHMYTHTHTHTHVQTQCHLLEVVVSQQVAVPQHVVVCEVWVQVASGVGPFSALSNLLGGHEWPTDCCLH